jgi:hypothetical protein
MHCLVQTTRACADADMPIVTVQQEACALLTATLAARPATKGVIFATLVGSELWTVQENWASWKNDVEAQSLTDIRTLRADAVAVLMFDGEGAVMLSADRDGRRGASLASRPFLGEAPAWHSPPEVPDAASPMLRPFQAALGLTPVGA